MLGALGMVLSSLIKQLENFAGVMNFVIFPMFFASSALYPLWRVQEGSPGLAKVCALNPFTHAVELIRFAFWGKFEPISFSVVLGCTIVFLGAAIFAYDPSRGMLISAGRMKASLQVFALWRRPSSPPVAYEARSGTPTLCFRPRDGHSLRSSRKYGAGLRSRTRA